MRAPRTTGGIMPRTRPGDDFSALASAGAQKWPRRPQEQEQEGTFMDADRFDALARTLRSATTRRAALGGVVAGVLGLLGVPAAADRRPTRSDRRRSPAREAHQRHVL